METNINWIHGPLLLKQQMVKLHLRTLINGSLKKKKSKSRHIWWKSSHNIDEGKSKIGFVKPALRKKEKKKSLNKARYKQDSPIGRNRCFTTIKSKVRITTPPSSHCRSRPSRLYSWARWEFFHRETSRGELRLQFYAMVNLLLV